MLASLLSYWLSSENELPGISVAICPRLRAAVHSVFTQQKNEDTAMLVVMQSHATEEQVRAVCDRIESLGL